MGMAPIFCYKVKEKDGHLAALFAGYCTPVRARITV